MQTPLWEGLAESPGGLRFLSLDYFSGDNSRLGRRDPGEARDFLWQVPSLSPWDPPALALGG